MPPAPSLEAQSHPPTVGRCPRASILTLRQSDDPQRIIHQKMALISILIFRVNNRVNFARRIAIREWPLRIRWIKQEQLSSYRFHLDPVTPAVKNHKAQSKHRNRLSGNAWLYFV